MEIVVATRNKHKTGELEKLFSGFLPKIRLLTLDDIGFESEIEETGSSFEENASIKAKAVAARGFAGLGDDSGLCVRALGGEPGIYSARYAGVHGDDAANNALLLKNLAGKTDRSAYFACALALALPDGRTSVVLGRADGEILEFADGVSGFGYDPLFYYPPEGMTFARMSAERKNRVSHRYDAVKKLSNIIAGLTAEEKC